MDILAILAGLTGVVVLIIKRDERPCFDGLDFGGESQIRRQISVAGHISGQKLFMASRGKEVVFRGAILIVAMGQRTVGGTILFLARFKLHAEFINNYLATNLP